MPRFATREVARGFGSPASPAGSDLHGGRPTVPLDPPTAWGLSALLAFLGRDLVRAGRSGTVVAAAGAFAVLFALSVQPFLFLWPDWMLAYAAPAERLPPGAVAAPFFVAVAGAGIAGAFVTVKLIEDKRTVLALVNVAFGLFLWASIWALTWDAYFHVGSWAEYHAGTAPPLAEAPGFQKAMNLAGLVQVTAGLGLAAYVVVAGRRVKKRRKTGGIVG